MNKLNGWITATAVNGDEIRVKIVPLERQQRNPSGMSWVEVGKKIDGTPLYFFQTIYDYQTILELLKWNDKGNFDRVSEMLIHALQWKLNDVEAAKELAHRKKATIENYNDNIWDRDWFV